MEELERDVECPTCGRPCSGRQHHNIQVGTDVDCVVICLSRHGYSPETHQEYKATRHVDIPLEIKVGERSFSFAACCVHLGPTASNGHYVAWVREDERFKRISSGHATWHQRLGDNVENNATMLFYQRQEPPDDPESLCAELQRALAEGDAPSSETAHAASAGMPAAHSSVEATPAGPAAQPDTATPLLAQATTVAHQDDDTWVQFTDDVEAVLDLFKRGGDCVSFLQRLPPYLESPCMCDNANTVQMLEHAARILEWAPTRAEDLVKQQTQLWKCGPYPLIVMFEAYSRATGIPTVFYWDSFLAFFSSLIHRDVAVHIGGFDMRARYWVAGTAQPGTGKSPALDPFRKVLVEVLRTHADLAPGTSTDNFHVQQASTHAAAVHRLRCTEGYQVICSGEGGPMLCPTWATNSTWNQGTHINLQRYLDTAYGNAVSWDTMVERRANRLEKGMPPGVAEDQFIETTNVTVVILQQLSVFSMWWAQGEARNNIGLASRFLFTFAGSHPPGPTSLHRFAEAVVYPVLRRLFTLVLQQLGPKHPIQPGNPRATWRLGHEAEEFAQNIRLACSQLTRRSQLGETYVAGLQKVIPWLAQCSLYNTLLVQLLPAIGDANSKPVVIPDLGEAAIRCAVRFYALRFLPGLAALQVEVLRGTWRQRRNPLKPAQSSTCQLAAAFLRIFPGLRIRYTDVTREAYIFGDTTGTDVNSCGATTQTLRQCIRLSAAKGPGRSRQFGRRTQRADSL